MPKPPVLIAIVGGSGSGKGWLAQKVADAFPGETLRVTLDDFYRDRSHLLPTRRELINFDHPRAIDWNAFETAMNSLARGEATGIPHYDFSTHSRDRQAGLIRPKPFVIVDGLWLLRRPIIRKLFNYTIFLDCPTRLRLQRRLARDLQSRGRTAASIRKQFRTMVEPMHRRFVAPQSRFATVILRGQCEDRDVSQIIAELRKVRS